MTTIVTRAGKGSPLTHVEVDTNFTNLNTNKLEAGAIALGSAAAPSISFVSDTNTGIFSPGADQLAISTSGVQRLSIGSTGNIDIDSNTVFVDAVNNRVGIGTSSPDSSLHIETTLNRIIRASSSDTGTTNNLLINNGSNYHYGVLGNVSGTTLVGGDVYGLGYTASAGADFTPVLSWTANTGRVGIGTTGPSFLVDCIASSLPTLRIYDNLGSGTRVSGRLLLGASTTRGVSIENSTDTYDDINSMVFSTTDSGGVLTPRARIDPSGRLLVGIIASPAHQLQVSTDSAGKPSTNTWTIVSDERIKEEIELADLDLCYAAVKSIPLKRFKWKDEVYTEEQVRDRRKLGWIAQDVEAVFPKAVGTYEFKYNQVFEETIIPAVEEELDDEGNVTTPAQPERIEKGELISEDVIEDCRDLNSDQLYAAMYGAIQKLMIKVEALETEITSLKAIG